MRGSWAQLSSHRLALLVAAANVTVCAIVGVTLLIASSPATPEPPPVAAQLTTTVPPSTATEAATTSPTVPSGFEPVTGPNGFSTVLPAGWPVSRADGPDAMESADPAEPSTELRFGGAWQPTEGLVESHRAYERQIAAQRPGYQLIDLRETTLRGTQAVVWEFEWDAAQGRRHSRSMYWRSQGVEYFCYAASSPENWPSTEAILTTMLEHARP